jgi:LPS-assembly protein
MKNKIKTYLILFFLSLAVGVNVSANEFNFDTSEMIISDKGNIIQATSGVVTSVTDNIEIKANEFKYNKKLSLLEAEQGYAKSINDNIEIKANKFKYNSKESIINIDGNIEIKDFKNKILIKSQSIFYNTKDKIIKSKNTSTIEDSLGNFFETKNFTYTLNDNLIKITGAKIVDIEKNIIKVEKAYINLKSNKLIGKDLSIDFNNKSFDKRNEPRLKGNTISADNQETVVSKGSFTLCKRNDDCPPWQLSAKEIRHDKKRKIIHYKSAWLKLYDKPVLYFPRFFHPDPTVKRQSGFLMPTFTDSSSLGASFHIPYYKVIADNKDLTLRSRFYSNDKVLLQTEYREINNKDNHLFDFSYLGQKNASGKSHFFSKTTRKLELSNFEDSELSLELQHTTNDTYLKTYKIKSPLINDEDTLTSTFSLNAYREDLSFNGDIYVYENLKKLQSDRYEFIYPSFTLSKQLDLDTEFNGNFSLVTNGHLKNYDTNIFEKVLINDLIFNSDSLISDSGLKSGYNFLIKNVNTDSKNSSAYKENSDHKLASIIEFNSSYPLIKKAKNYTNILKPIISLRFSPNNSKDMTNDDKRMDTGNIFSFNRLGINDAVEGGSSLTYGSEFSKTDRSNKEIFSAKIANNLRFEKDDDLPNSNALGEKTSDILGNLNYIPNDVFKINYDFAVKNNLSDKNYELLSADLKINNFVTTFEYFNENNAGGKESYLDNKSTYTMNDASSISFETRENKKTKATEFHNLIYQYRNDCLIAAIEYNKDYYSDRDRKPEENIFFKLTIIPFGQTSSPNLK